MAGRGIEALTEQIDVEHIAAEGLFIGCEQVEQQCRQTGIVQDGCGELVARAVAAAAAAVCKHDNAPCVVGDNQPTREHH